MEGRISWVGARIPVLKWIQRELWEYWLSWAFHDPGVAGNCRACLRASCGQGGQSHGRGRSCPRSLRWMPTSGTGAASPCVAHLLESPGLPKSEKGCPKHVLDGWSGPPLLQDSRTVSFCL